jgi:hypothetical protein
MRARGACRDRLEVGWEVNFSDARNGDVREGRAGAVCRYLRVEFTLFRDLFVVCLSKHSELLQAKGQLLILARRIALTWVQL